MLLCGMEKSSRHLDHLIEHRCCSRYDFHPRPTDITEWIGNCHRVRICSKTGNQQIDALLSRGGIESMMPTVSLIILTLSLGGLLIEFGLISTVMDVVS